MKCLDDYRPIVGDKVIAEIYKKASRLHNKSIVHVNSTYQGGGVAEMLNSIVPLMNDIGVDTDWRTLHGSPDFFNITKKFHNALQGGPINMTEIKKELYIETNENFCSYSRMNYDFVIIHDPQPLPCIKFHRKMQPWVWRCHIDLTAPNAELWDFIRGFLLKYDIVIVSSTEYIKKELPVEQRVIYPIIDPLSLKNKALSEDDINKYVAKSYIPMDKPIITQVSRMDPWKDPKGLLDIFDMVKEEVDCRLVYCYDLATDDPEGVDVCNALREKAGHYIEHGDVVLVMGDNQIVVNAIQRFSDVIVQNSIREGFCLAVTEGLWKQKPMVATRVGGIPLQITDGETGFLVDPGDTKAFADRIIYLLKHPDEAQNMGTKAREMVRDKFLITRGIADFLDVMNDLVD